MRADGTRADRCRFKDLCVDAADQHRLAAFWAAALGLGAEVLDNGAYRLVDDVAEHTVWVNPVPEPRTVKQRVH
ncbi:MAG: VOC family protein, partial [Propionibacteriaceae bacterium]